MRGRGENWAGVARTIELKVHPPIKTERNIYIIYITRSRRRNFALLSYCDLGKPQARHTGSKVGAANVKGVASMQPKINSIQGSVTR